MATNPLRRSAAEANVAAGNPHAVSPRPGAARCLLFAYHEMGYGCMEALLKLGAPMAGLFTHEDDSHEQIWWRSCAELARSHGVPVYTPERLDQPWIERIAAIRPAIIYSFYYRNLLPDPILRTAPLGAYNMHGSLLPAYRGRAPVNWMLVNGEREAGVTLHHMVARADAGDIVGQRSLVIDDSDTALTLFRKLVPLGVALLAEMHPLIAAGAAPRRPQDLSRGSYFGRRRPEDGRIDWRWPVRRIFNLVRAVTHPYPGAFCWLNGRKLFVWESRIALAEGRRGAPGEIVGIVSAAGGAVEVAAGEGNLLILRAQFEGAPESAAAEVLSEILSQASHGAGPRAGVRLE
jgi:methionyl-tRNA formyltransferase